MENKYLEKIAVSSGLLVKALGNRVAKNTSSGIKTDLLGSAMSGGANKTPYRGISKLTKKKITSGSLDAETKKQFPNGVLGVGKNAE
jgi:hypothetical protein